jgi:stearoyl-CoA desaturase (delta-9 desaturase)
MSNLLQLLHGTIQLPWWGYVLVTLGLTQITIAAVTLYLHRAQAHRAVDLHPIVSHFFRFWLWLTTGMVTKEWVAVHRKHHAKVESEEDPHSPKIKGIRTVMLQGAELYAQEAANPETLAKYGHGTPDDWLERNLYGRWSVLGLSTMAAVDFLLFGLAGITIWAVQMLWIPFWAAGVINGAAHYWGYRNFETSDSSTNLAPLALFIGGEELHNNHHAYSSSARFSVRPWEFDIGWLYIRGMRALGLARVKKEAPRPVIVEDKGAVDAETVTALIRARLQVSADYARKVILPVLREELVRADASCRRLLKRGGRLLTRDESQLDAAKRERRDNALAASRALRLVYDYQRQLQAIWDKTMSQDKLIKAVQEWCARAEASGVAALQAFARSLKGYSLQAA